MPRPIKPAALILLSLPILLWPAILNGYPFLVPDSLDYLSTARWVWPALSHPFTHHVPDMRAEIFGLGLGLLHWQWSPWPVVIFGALITSYLMWLVMRSLKMAEVCFAILVPAISLTTSVSWFASAILADVFTPVTELALGLLMLFWDKLSKAERWVVAALAWFALVAHATHLLVASGLCVLMAVPVLGKWDWLPVRKLGWMAATGIVFFAVFSQIGMHLFLYGKATLNGNPAPYLMARAIADGPGKMYLQQHCGALDWEICRHVAELPSTDDEFLWKVGGVWNSSTPAERARLSAEQMPLVLATVRTYPQAQLHQSMENFWKQLTTVGLTDFAWPNPYVPAGLDKVIPGSRERYLATRQASRSLPIAFFEYAQKVMLVVALGVTVVLLPVAWLKKNKAMIGFSVVVTLGVILNAAVCGMFSGIYPRYEGRVMWLVVFVAMLLVVGALERQIPASNS